MHLYYIVTALHAVVFTSRALEDSEKLGWVLF